MLGGGATLLLLFIRSWKAKAKAEIKIALSALPQYVNAPSDNPLSIDRVALGRLLFWDPITVGE